MDGKECCKQTITEFINKKFESNSFNWYDNLVSEIEKDGDFMINTTGAIEKQAHVELGQRKSKSLLKKEDMVESSF